MSIAFLTRIPMLAENFWLEVDIADGRDAWKIPKSFSFSSQNCLATSDSVSTHCKV